MSKRHLYYYFDEVNDDFANTNIEQKPTPDDWEYLPKNKIYRFFNIFLYYPLIILCKFAIRVMGIKLKNKKVIKEAKKQKKGIFIYGNHTNYFPDAVTGHIASGIKRNYIIVNPDAVNIKGLRWLTKGMGALPLPHTKTQFVSYLNAINKIIEKKRVITIYPEAHIWPKYSEIRDFPIGSFGYPAKLGTPVLSKTTVYSKKKDGTTKPTIYFDGPFYPDMTLPLKDRQKKLRDEVYLAMKERTIKSEKDINYVYTKVNTKEEMKMVVENI